MDGILPFKKFSESRSSRKSVDLFMELGKVPESSCLSGPELVGTENSQLSQE
jgi:hypothetical protein